MSRPNNESLPELALLIDAYLDGAMTTSERHAFESRLTTDAALAREFQLQRRIDTRLGLLMAPPESPALATSPDAVIASSIPIAQERRGIPTWLRVAAVLALVAIGTWAAVARPWHVMFGPERSDVAANVAYRELVKGGLKPMWVCESDEVFRKYTKDTFGVPFAVTPGPGVELVGWTYASGLLDSSASVLMCRVEGKPSIVVVGKLSDDRAMHADVASNVKVHRKQQWGLVMYEVNEREDAPILDRMKGE